MNTIAFGTSFYHVAFVLPLIVSGPYRRSQFIALPIEYDPGQFRIAGACQSHYQTLIQKDAVDGRLQEHRHSRLPDSSTPAS
jgi:hypothetical protein